MKPVAIASKTVTSDFGPSSAVEALCEPGGFHDGNCGTLPATYFGLHAHNMPSSFGDRCCLDSS